MSGDYTQVLDDYGVLASVGDAYDNALAESFVDSCKTELIADRTWKSRSQLELGLAGYLGWFNNDRLHERLGDIPPVEFEALHAARAAISGNGSSRPADRRPAEQPIAHGSAGDTDDRARNGADRRLRLPATTSTPVASAGEANPRPSTIPQETR